MAIEKQTATFGTPAERAYGYAQAVRAGDTVHVSGQVATAEDGSIVGGDMAAQMRQAYANVAKALRGCGAEMSDIVDEILFVIDIRAASRAARDVRREAYGEHVYAVASTLVQVAALGRPEMLIEIRCVAKV